MIEESGKDNGYRSFEHWAKGIVEKVSEPVKETPVQENLAQSEKLETAQLVKESKTTGDVVSTLLEKLSDFDDWEVTPEPVRVPKMEAPPSVEKKEEPVMERVEPLVEKKIEEEPTPIKKEPAPEPKRPEPVQERVEEVQEETKNYKVFRDRDENFECNLSIEGASLTDAKARIVLESDAWNFVFYGKVYGDGRCVVPIKRGLPLVEGAIGNIKLEVIADDQLFVGWEDTFKVAVSKKVKVDLKEQRSVRVSFNNSLNENRNS